MKTVSAIFEGIDVIIMLLDGCSGSIHSEVADQIGIFGYLLSVHCRMMCRLNIGNRIFCKCGTQCGSALRLRWLFVCVKHTRVVAFRDCLAYHCRGFWDIYVLGREKANRIYDNILVTNNHTLYLVYKYWHTHVQTWLRLTNSFYKMQCCTKLHVYVRSRYKTQIRISTSGFW